MVAALHACQIEFPCRTCLMLLRNWLNRVTRQIASSRFPKERRSTWRLPKRRTTSVPQLAETLEERALLAATLTAALDGSGNLVITDTSGAANQLTLSRSGNDIVITDAAEEFDVSAISGSALSNSNKTITIPSASITGTAIFVAADGGSDSLTVDLSTDLGFDVDYAGGTGNTDSLTVSGGAVTTVTHTLTNANDGSISVVTLGTRVISYTGLEPITDNLAATDRIFTFNGGAETITLADAAGSNITIDSTLSESITFPNPMNSLTINAGSGDDIVNLNSFDAAFNASLSVNGDGATDTINAKASLALTGTNSISLSAESLVIGAVTLSTINGGQTYNGAISLSGSTLTTSGTGVVTLGGDVTINGSAASTIAGKVDLNSATRNFNVNDVAVGDDIIISAAVEGAGDGLVKSGVGEMLLSGTNSYSGATTINDGVLALSNNSSLAATSGVTATATATGGVGIKGSRVELRNVVIAGVPLTLNSNSAGDLRSGLITTTAGSNEWTGAVTLQGNGTTYFAAGDAAGENLIVSGNVTGAGFTGTHKLRSVSLTGLGSGTINGTMNLGGSAILFKDDANNWTINSTGNSWNTTQVGRGTLTIGANDALATGARLQMGDAHAFDSKLILNGFNQRLGSVVKVAANTGTARIVNGSATPVVFTIDTSSTADYSGIIGGPGANENNLSVVKQGSGFQTLSGLNTYSGTTTINAGVLGTNSNSASIGDGSSTNTLIFNGGTLFMGGFVSPSTRPVQFLADATIRDTGFNNEIAGQITGVGGLVKQHSGILTLSNTTNTFGGVGKVISLEDGTISIPADSALGNASNNIVFTSNTPTVRATATTSTNRSVTLTSNGRFDAAGGSTFTVNGLLTGSGQLFMGSVGAVGTVVLTNGSNNYSGSTHVDFGVLQVTADHALGTAAGSTDVSTGAVLDLPNVTYATAEQIILNNSTLRVSSGTTSLAGGVDFNSGTPTIDVLGTQLTIAGALTNVRNVTKTGSGKLVLTGTSTHTGVLTVAAGTLQVDGSLANGAAANDVIMQSGTTLAGSGTINGAVDAQSGSTINPGPATGSLSLGGVTMTSGTTFNVDLNGNTPGTQYDLLSISGNVTLGNATLTLNVGFSPANNTNFTIINNTGANPVSGTFNGLPEGSVIIIGPTAFVLTYQGGTGNDVVLRSDTIPPFATSFARLTPATSPTNANSLVFRATFSEDVKNVTAADFTVTGGTTATITAISPVSSSIYDITISGGDLANFNGTVGLDIAVGQDILDTANLALTNTEPAIDETYLVDNTAPQLSSFTRFTPATSPTNADTLIFRATFNEGVSNVSAGDFVINSTTTATITAVTPVSSSVYEITISGGDLASFNGTVGLNVDAAQDIVDLAGNALPTAEPATDETYVVDNVAPSTTSFTRFNPATSPTNANTLVFRATFNEPVTNVTTGDFTITGGTTATVTAITPVSSSVYELTVSGGDLASFNGTVGIDFAPAEDITDLAGNALPNTEPAIDQTYVLDNTAPNTTSFARFNPATSPTNANSLIFRATFSEDVTNVDATDFTVTGGTTATITSVSPVSGSLYELTVSGGNLSTFSGTVGLDFAPGLDITDSSGNALPNTEPTIDQTYAVDHTAPFATSFARFNPANSPTAADTLIFRATFSEAVSNVDITDFAVNGTTTATITNVTPISSSLYEVTVSGGDLASFTGEVGLDLAVGQDIADGVGNAASNTEPAIDELYAVDNTNPVGDIIDIAPDPRFIVVSTITITFDEAVTGFDLSDLALTFNGGPNLLTGAQTLTTLDNITFTLGNLAGLTATDGPYDLTLTAAGSGIADLAGNLLTTDATDDWTKLPAIFEYGDAPDTYGTTNAANGPYHIATGLRLGATRDTEDDAFGPLDGTGDDVTNSGSPDDEDGSLVLAPIVRYGTSGVRITASAAGFLDAWLDLDANGVFSDPAERFGAGGFGTAGSLAVPAGTTTIILNIPASVTNVATTTYARFRLSTAGGLAADTGFALDGEIEDQVALIASAPPVVMVDDSYAGATPGDILDGGIFGYDRFDTLAQGILVVADGGLVTVKPGTYPENVVIDKNVTLDGESGIASDVIINPPGVATPGIAIGNGSYTVTISDLSVTDALNGIESQTTGSLALLNIDSSNNAGDGLNAIDAAVVSITNSTLNSNGDDGIDFNSATGNISVKGTDAASNAAQGINVSAANIVTLADGTFSGISVLGANGFVTQTALVSSTKPINVEAQNGILLRASIDAGDNTIRFAANLDGAGSEFFNMFGGTTMTTTNDTPNAVQISVNTLLGGNGTAILEGISAGTTAGPTGGRITVSAVAGSIRDGNGSSLNLTAGNALLRANGGVGAAINALDGSISNLEASGGGGGVYLDNYRPLTIGQISGVVGVSSTGTGPILINNQGSLTVTEDVIGGGLVVLHTIDTAGAGDDLTVQSGVVVRSTVRDIDLGAGDDIFLQAGSLIEALVRGVVIKGDNANADAAGSSIYIDGIINSALGATVNGDSDDDSIFVTAMGTGGLLLDGLGGNDTYSIVYPDLPTTLGSTITINDSVDGHDEVVVYGTNFADELFLTTQDPPTTATTEEISRGAIGTERIVLHDNLELASIYLLDEIDVMHAQPSMLFPVFLDGGEPCFGDPGVPPGDQLVFDPFGNTFSISGNVISTDGGAPNPFQSVSFVDFESLPLVPLGAPPGGEMLLDFNHTNTASSVSTSPTQTGYIGVPQETLYSLGLGYGWQAPIKSFERDDGFYGNTYSDLTRDGHWLDTPSVFTVDLPNGWYLISAMVGSPYSSISGVSIQNADTGGTLVSNISTGPGESKSVAFAAYVSDGTLDLQFNPGTSYPKVFAVNGLSIRPGVLLSMGLDCPPGGLGADGVTVDSFTLFEAPPNSLITVATSLGTIMNVDADDELQGIQIRTDALGQATVLLRRPTGAGTAILTFEEVTGAKTGVSSVEYVSPSTRYFDFNHVNLTSSTGQSPTQAPVASIGFPDGFQGVPESRLYSSTNGFGWITSPRGFDLGGLTNSQGESIPDPNPLGDLRRDGNYDAVARSFRVDLPNGSYRYEATIGYDRDIDGMQINANGSITSGINVAAGNRVQINGTFTVVNGFATFTFSDASGTAPNWVINGLNIQPVVTVAPIMFQPNIGATPADGITITPVRAITGLADGEQVTVTTSLGTIVTPDVNPTVDGVQVYVTGGQVLFDVLAPTIPGTPTFTATSLDGSNAGTITSAAFLTYTIPTGRRFDFNHLRSSSSTGPSKTAVGFVGVLRTDLDRVGDGFGWDIAPNSYDNAVFNEYDNSKFPQLTTDLYSDVASGHTSLGSRTFSVLARPGATYDLTVYLGGVCHDMSTQVLVEGIALPQSINLGANHFDYLQFVGAFDADHDGFIEITFSSTGAISPFWSANGLDIVESGSGLPLPAPISAKHVGTGYGVDSLTTEELAPLVTIAINSWAAQGISSQELAMLQATQFMIRDLGNGGLALVDGNRVINLDDNAAGHGWSLQADKPSGDRYDLLTVLAHEMGHLLGHEDLNPLTAGDELMNAFLGLGERHEILNGIDGFFSL